SRASIVRTFVGYYRITYNQILRGISKRNAFALEGIVDEEIDRLIDVHVLVEIVTQNEVHRFEYQAEFAKRREMRTVKKCVRLVCHCIFQNTRDDGEFFFGRVVHHAGRKNNTSPLHPFEIVEPRIGKVGIRENKLLPGQRPHARSFYAYGFNGSAFIFYHDEIAYLKRTVEKQYEVVE